MRVHHLNCGTMCPLAARLVNGKGGLFSRGKMVCHCLLIETDQDGLVLVDSGFGTAELADPDRLHRAFLLATAPRFDPVEPAVAQIVRLGFRPKDLRHVVVTHLDLDHAGGIADFPWAEVHLHQREYQAAVVRPVFLDRVRYVKAQWAHGPKWVQYDDQGDDWFGFFALRPLLGLKAEIALIPLFGHSRGHSGVAVRSGGRWLLHAGDAYFFHGELEASPSCPAGLAGFQSLAAADDHLRKENRRRLARLRTDHAAELDIFCAHDPVELERHTRS